MAIVGSRAATPYALEVGARLGAELAERGVVVTSGLARGVDSAAHRAASGRRRDHGGARVRAGTRLPARARGLAAQNLRKGLSSASWARRAALPEHFPLRNRIISGISLAVVVVEASEKSGSLITARMPWNRGGT